MYLLYVVPIQGKDAEISHMKYVSQQFIELKSDIDTLIINDRVNMPIARSFELGTLSSTGQGSLSILPINSFIEAAGTLVVNEQMDTLQVQGNFLTKELPSFIGSSGYSGNPDIPAQWVDGEHLYVYYPGINSEKNSTIKGNITKYSATYSEVDNTTHIDVTNESYGHYVIRPEQRLFINNVTRAYDIDPYWLDPLKSVNVPNMVSWIMNSSGFNSNNTPPGNNTTDFMTVKNQTDIIFEFFNSSPDDPKSTLLYTRTLQENATSGNHTFDLSKINEIVTTDPNLLGFNLTDYYPGGYGDPVWMNIAQPAQPLGSLQYWSQNRYWINQELLYEMGGLFLRQGEGVSIMLIPSLSVTPTYTYEGTPTVKVSLVDISITDTNDVSGSKSAQVFAKIDSINKNQLNELVVSDIIPHSLASEEPNTRFLVLTFRPQPEATDLVKETTTKLWKRAFDQVYVITQKTMSERHVIGTFDTWMTTLYTDPASGGEYSANLFIGEGIKSVIDNYDLTHTDPTLDDYVTYLKNWAFTDPLPQPLYFDYTKADLSLVIQSGAL